MNYILLLGMPGGGELIFIVLIIIMLFGSKKIPELARGLGKGMREIKNATGDIQREIREGAREINAAKASVNVEKQVENLIKEEKSVSKEEQEENITEETPPQPEAIRRRGPYEKEEPQTPTENS